MKEHYSVWKFSSISVSVLLFLPILAIFVTAVGQTDEVFAHLMSTVMPTYGLNTVILTLLVMLLTLILGVPCAWLMAMCKLPGERILQWALVLPLAMPGYIVGYIYTDWLDYAGAGIILSMVLYPYVYLLCRAGFMEQNVTLLQSARLLKCSPWESFRRVSLPLVRPSMAIGLSLVAMETIGDFGTVSYFAVNTLTTAIYDTWLGYSNLNAAAKISAIMLLVVLCLLSAERFSRRKQKLFQSQFSSHEDLRYKLTGWQKWLALGWCWGIVFFAFLLPLGQLTYYAMHYFSQSWTEEFRQFALNSLKVSCLAALFSVAVAVVVNFFHRLRQGRSSQTMMRLASMGYAVPGTVLAIGVMVPVLALDHWVNDLAKWSGLGRPGLLFSGTLFAIVFAMVVRFSAVAIGSIESSLSKISPSLDMAARTMGCRPNRMLRQIHLPLVRWGALIAGLLVFIEAMKELNAALLLRPFNFETLATYVYNFASDEQLELAALPAVLLIVVGLIPLIMVNHSLEKNH